MPVFARRRLQAMLDELAPLLQESKTKDLLTRLEHKSAKNSLAAEVELALLWGIHRVADLQIDPEMDASAARPDAFSRTLFVDRPAVIEITAISDDAFSGQIDMDRAANIICQFSDRVRRRSGAHLHFQFAEISTYDKGRYSRKRRVTGDFKLSTDLENALRAWIGAPDWPNPAAIRLTDRQIDVVIRWKKFVHPQGRTFCTMPAVAYDVEDNPVFKALERKEKRQLTAVPEGTLKCVFLGDAGCAMLRELKPFGGREIGGEQVIRHFLTRSAVDVVCVFSPYRSLQILQMPGSRKPNWKISLFTRTNVPCEAECSLIREMVAQMPQPQLEGYQARSWQQQGLFNPQGKGNYVGCKMTSRNGSLSIGISSRLVLELLAGRITPAQFQEFAFGKDCNQFDHQFSRGMTIQSARLEKGGLDRDDDHLVFDLEPDAGAQALRNPKLK